MTEDHTAFADGHLEPTIDFPYELLDRGNPIVAELTEANQPNKEYREAALLFLDELSRMLSFIVGYEHPKLAAYTIAHAMAMTPITGNKDMRQIGEELGVTKAAISKCVKKVQRSFGRSINGIGPMLGQKSPEACQKYSQSRKKNLL